MIERYSRDQILKKTTNSMGKRELLGIPMQEYIESYGNDLEVVMSLLNVSSRFAVIIGDEIKNDIISIVHLSQTLGGNALKVASDDIKDNPNYVLTLTEISSQIPYKQYLSGETYPSQTKVSAFQYASERVRGMASVVLQAIKIDHKNFNYAGKSLCADPEFLANAVLANNNVIELMNEDTLRLAAEGLIKNNDLTNAIKGQIENRVNSIRNEKQNQTTYGLNRTAQYVGDKQGGRPGQDNRIMRDQYGGQHKAGTPAVPGQDTTRRR